MGNDQIVLLKCTSSYPAPINEANLCMIKDFSDKYGLISGLSDHTLGVIAPVLAVSFGAKIIEKHFILDRSVGGPDASFSLNEKEFTDMVHSIRTAEQAIGSVDYKLTKKQVASRMFSKSLYAIKDIKKGDNISESNVKSIRPGYGLHPKYFKNIIGKSVNNNIKKGERINLDLFNNTIKID